MSKTYFLPLGGTGEIGMNLNLYGYQSNNIEEWIMVDCGVTFSQSGLPGIDLQMADPNYIVEKKKDLKGIKENTKKGHDFAGRVFVIKKTGAKT